MEVKTNVCTINQSVLFAVIYAITSFERLWLKITKTPFKILIKKQKNAKPKNEIKSQKVKGYLPLLADNQNSPRMGMW